MKNYICILIIGILLIANQNFAQTEPMDKIENEYLKINHQDGLVYFEDFRIADILLIKKNENTYRLDLDIKTYDGPYSKTEKQDIEKRIGRTINNEYSYAWISIENKEVKIPSIEEIENLKFEIEKGWDEEAENGLASIYFGWGIELLNNQISFSKVDKDLFINWKAVSGDVNYYDERAKQTTYEMKIKVNILELEDEKEISERWKRLANLGERYFEIIRNMTGHPIPNHDLPVHEKIDEEYGVEHSKKAWKLAPKIMEEFPKKKSY